MSRSLEELQRLYGEETPYTFLNELDFNRADTVKDFKGNLVVFCDGKSRVKNTKQSKYEEEIERRLKKSGEIKLGYITSCNRCKKCKTFFQYRRKGRKRLYCDMCKRKKESH